MHHRHSLIIIGVETAHPTESCYDGRGVAHRQSATRRWYQRENHRSQTSRSRLHRSSGWEPERLWRSGTFHHRWARRPFRQSLSRDLSNCVPWCIAVMIDVLSCLSLLCFFLSYRFNFKASPVVGESSRNWCEENRSIGLIIESPI